jgi:hydroxypyruvate reductase
MTSSIAKLRMDAQHIFQAGVTAADPYAAVQQYLHYDAQQQLLSLHLNDGSCRQGKWPKVHLIAFGKAACTMISAAQAIIPEQHIAGTSIAVTNYENVQKLANIEVIGANHPLPDAAGLLGAQKIAVKTELAQQGELVLVLVSGGGSALLPSPVSAISLSDKITTTELLLTSGASINEVNCVRKHLSQLKGGGLAKLAAPADVHTLILSDVLGDKLSAIASGPTVADNSTFAEAVAILQNRNLWEQVPLSVQTHLEQGTQALHTETPKSNNAIFTHTTQTIIGSNSMSVQAIIQASATLNYVTYLYSNQLIGEARVVAEQLVIYTKNLLSQGMDMDRPCAILAGGETTVTLQGSGLGGRNQEMALAFTLAAEKHQLDVAWVFLSGGTDGIDGPTNAAGGLVDNKSLQRMHSAKIEPAQYLANNDAYHALQISEDLLMTGATGTNVADLQILLISPQLI